MSPRSAVVLLLFGVLVSCGQREGPEYLVSVRDSAGVRIVEHRSFPADLPHLRLDSLGTETFDGSDTGLNIFFVSGAFRGVDGSVVIGDGGNRRILRFGADGGFLSSTGRQGQGPGEFQHLSLLSAWRADSLIAWDSSLRRLSVFSPEGRFERSFSLERSDSVQRGFVQAVFENGPIMATGPMDIGGRVTSGLHRYSSPVYLFDSDGSFRVSMGMVPGAEQYYEANESGFSSMTPLFSRSTEKVLSEDRLVLASNDTYEVVFYSWEGEPTQLIRHLAPPVPVTSSIRRQAEEALLGQTTDPEAQVEMRARLRRMPVAETLPAYGRVFGDRIGRVWIEEYVVGARAYSEWHVFGRDGSILFLVEMPTRFQPTDAGSDYILGVLKSELDVESVVLALLEKSPD